jgi:4-carboxymuconolactone decarboxylase
MQNMIIAAFITTFSSMIITSAAVIAKPKIQTSTGNIPLMEISKNDTRTVNKGSADFFTGNVQVEPLAQGSYPARVSAGKVTFEPCARSAWHTHPLGQMLIITDGCGLVQEWGKPAQVIQQGDVIWTPPNIKHWHGANSNSKMTHIAIQESLNGKNVEWLDHVTESEYKEGCACGSALSVLDDVAPALAKYDKEALQKLWERPDLTKRDRCIITLAALIVKNQTVEMSRYFNLALNNGVSPAELSEIITHLAFYSGWSNAVSAANVAKNVFAERKISPDLLPKASPELLPLNRETEEARAANVEQQFGRVAPGVVQYTTDVLFRDLWLRPDLKPRDRSLVTFSALIACGQVAQIPYHLKRAMDNGLTQPQASEVMTHLAFYVGWPNVFSAMPIAKDVFEKQVK